MVEAVSYTGSRNPGRGGSGGAKAKEEKARSCTIAHAPAARIFYGRPHRPKASHFPLALYPIAWEEGIQREKGKVVFGRSRSGRRIYLYRRPCSESRSFFIWIPGAISCKVSREKVKTPKGKGWATFLKVRIVSSHAVHVNCVVPTARSVMTAVALPYVPLRVHHQPFPFGCLGR